MDNFKSLLRNLRDGGWSSAWGFLRAGEIHDLLRGLANEYEPHDQEIHILTGDTRLTMALWMIASWITTTQRNWKFVIHDDGSLSQKYQKELPDLLPGCRVIGSKEAADFIQKRLQNHPLSGECRQIHPLCRKLFDIPLMTTKQKILMIDTDILFFRHPDQILNWLCEPSQHTLFMEDIQDATVNPAFDFARQKGFTMIPKVNTGIVGMNREIYDLDFFEECLAQTDMIKSDRWFIEQSLFALLSSIKGDVEFLDSSYHMELTPACPPDSVARHYMGKVRHLFYSEGIPIVKEMIQRERS